MFGDLPNRITAGINKVNPALAINSLTLKFDSYCLLTGEANTE